MMAQHWPDAAAQNPHLNRLWSVWHTQMCPDADMGVSEAAFAQLVTRYLEPHRAYHTLTHLAELLDHFDAHQDLIADKAAFLAVLFYHDAIYEIDKTRGKGQNERESAELAAIELPKLGFSPQQTAWAVSVIDATAHHKVAADDNDAALFMDMDMAVLAKPFADYMVYADQIRQEYAPLVSERDYMQGRIAFLTQTLAQGKDIFITPQFKPLQPLATANMQQECAVLQARLDALQSQPKPVN